MKKSKLYKTMSVPFRVAFFLLISLSLPLFFGCEDEEPEEAEAMSIGEITVYNIPASIPVFNNETDSNLAFKIYLNASNSMSESDPPVAKGVARLSSATQSNGKYSVTIKLQNPNSASNKDPNLDTGSWSGTASYFSIMICPQSVATYGESAIWAKGGMTLNKGKERCDWETLLMDFRVKGPDPYSLRDKSQALYTDIICEDPDITKN